ncbi:MAG: DUF58 domain-containing protein [Deltaproteobacteria bacterium]|jgi:uncharacterized protein (DUF58 family)|nr:DUF58 domain-containing protein [Deltaproteobacteria bacterium]
MLRPSLKALALFAATIPVTALIVALTPDLWRLTLIAPILALAALGVDLARAFPDRDLDPEISLPTLLFVGRESQALLSLKAYPQKKTVRKLQLEALLELDGPLKPPGPQTITLQGVEGVFPLPILGLRRGQADLRALWLRWRGPWGLAEIRSRRTLELSVMVSQDVYRVHQDTINFYSRQSLIGVKPQPFRGEGAEFESLTEFATGMDPRRIDWKRSGRHRRLLAREFRQERNNLIVFGFDTGRLSQEPVGEVTKLDHFVAAALRLGWVCLKSGDLVGGCGYDLTFHSFLQPGRGVRFFTQLRAFTAGLDYGLKETNHTLALAELSGRLPHRALIVLFTEFIDEVSSELLVESLALLTRRHMVIFVTVGDPLLPTLKNQRPSSLQGLASSVLADNFAKSRELVLNRIRRLGAYCVDAPAGQITSELLNRYLLIKQRGLL